jgi:hypothetical protein
MIRAAQASPDSGFCVFSNYEAVDDAKTRGLGFVGGAGALAATRRTSEQPRPQSQAQRPAPHLSSVRGPHSHSPRPDSPAQGEVVDECEVVQAWREDGDEGGVGHRSGRGLGCAAGTPSGYERDGHCLHCCSTTPYCTVHHTLLTGGRLGLGGRRHVSHERF